MKTFFRYCLIALVAIAMTACSPEDGKMGPAGPQGEQGLPGEDGNANVIASDWMDIVWNFQNEATFKAMHIDAAQITEEFIENGGTILMYLKQKDGNNYAVAPLPYAIGNDQFIFIYVNAPSFIPVGIMVQVTSIDTSIPVNEYDDGTYFFRYILIPGGTPAENALVKEGIDPTNYQAVSDFFNIKK